MQEALRLVRKLPVREQDLAAEAMLKFLAKGQKNISFSGSPKTKSQEHARKKELGNWGEAKAWSLLESAGFVEVRNVNQETHNHPFGDLFGIRNGQRFLIGVKTRNKLQANGKLNPSFNITKRGRDLTPLAKKYDAVLAWVAIQVQSEKQRFSAYWGTVNQIIEAKERYSIPMKPDEVLAYECLVQDKPDKSIKPEWTNRSYR